MHETDPDKKITQEATDDSSRKDSDEKLDEVCRKFTLGKCSFGDKCWYIHENTNVTGSKRNIKSSTTAIDSALLNSMPSENSVLVKGLPWKATVAEVMSFFSSGCGIAPVQVLLPLAADGRQSGNAIACFAHPHSIEKALALNGNFFPGSERWVMIDRLDSSNKGRTSPSHFSGQER